MRRRQLPHADRAARWCVAGLALAGLAGLPGCGKNDPASSFYNPLDPGNRPDLPVPNNVLVEAGSDRLRLTWGLPAVAGSAAVDEFAVFRSRVDDAGATIERQFLLIRTTDRSYLDTSVKNGLHYVYNVAAGDNGQFGPRSGDVTGTPALFNIILDDDAEVTRDPKLSVQFVAPAGTEAVQLSESETAPDASWRPLGQGSSWTLSAGDGPRTVYARFRLPGGSESMPVSDTIRLDTHARILSVGFTGAAVKSPGDPLHLTLDAGETGGSARVEIVGLFVALALYDDGTNGDSHAGDGVYELDTVVPGGQTVTGSVVTGRFTDAVGNEALAFDGPQRLSVQQVPDAVSLAAPAASAPPDVPAVLLEWSPSNVNDFAAYRLVRSVGAAPVAEGETVTLVTTRGQTQYRDTGVREGATYNYRVVVVTNTGLESASNTGSLTVPNVRPPAAVALQAADGVSTTRAIIRWGRCNDLDFGAYRLYRSTTAAVDNSGTPVAVLASADATSFVDDTLDENTLYHYRLYVVDLGGLATGSNEIEARTANLPPPGVQLSPATSVAPTALTLTWTLCDAHDFASYRVYRSETPNVTTAATLVREVDERNALSFRDTSVQPGKTYYYRIYVLDNGTSPGPLASGSNTISVTTPGA